MERNMTLEEKRLTDSDFITKPMYIKMYRKLQIITALKYLALIVIALAASGIATFVINWLFEPSFNVILKYSFIAIDFLSLGNYTSDLNTSSGFIIIDVFTEILGIFFLPVYLWFMFHNLILCIWMVCGCINQVFVIANSPPTPELISLINLDDSGAI